jgi:glycerate-2-kinase
VEGEAKNVGSILGALAKEIMTSSNPSSPPLGVVIGGETTVTVTGKGKGGRNQEIALAAALQIKGSDNVVIASVSTDGVDGPTDAAGAIADGNTISRSEEMKLNAEDYLKNNDSYSFFSKIGDLIYTGPTGTNVNDLSILVVL